MRYELTDFEWAAIRALLPNKPPRVDRCVLNGIFWVLRSGAPRRDFPEIYGPCTTCYSRWRQAGVWHRIMDALAADHDAAVQMIDTSVVRVHQHGACIADNDHQDMGRSRGGGTAREDKVSRRLMTIPGIGPVSATASTTLAPPAETFAKGRDFAAWLGLTPIQRSTGGKQKLGGTSKMGGRTLRRLLIIGSSAVVQASKRGAPKGPWLEQMLARKPRMPVTVALANKIARIIWALLVKQKNYRAPVAAKA
ncbi:transposase [Bradyrhizobium sp. CB1650]|uniref:transposase n=1 Tax=Bradyrhizobium sp. CB1650 TaxID=3039153 RepID=UPI002435F767|nr:transposase [Bradyrhizobium sp. CB1650]WGD54865.1 transposase [Bradyrhizobium sp. CB1650]